MSQYINFISLNIEIPTYSLIKFLICYTIYLLCSGYQGRQSPKHFCFSHWCEIEILKFGRSYAGILFENILKYLKPIRDQISNELANERPGLIENMWHCDTEQCLGHISVCCLGNCFLSWLSRNSQLGKDKKSIYWTSKANVNCLPWSLDPLPVSNKFN